MLHLLKKMSVLAVLIAAAGCGSAPAMDAELQSWADKFTEEANKNGVFHFQLTPMVFVDTIPTDENSPKDSVVLGRCYYSKLGKGEYIEISRVEWETSSDIAKFALIAHEQGHCAFDLGHASSSGEVMSPLLSYSEGSFERFWAKLKKMSDFKSLVADMMAAENEQLQ